MNTSISIFQTQHSPMYIKFKIYATKSKKKEIRFKEKNEYYIYVYSTCIWSFGSGGKFYILYKNTMNCEISDMDEF